MSVRVVLNLLFFVFSHSVFSQSIDSIQSKHGLIRVEGKAFNKQITLKNASGLRQLTQFAPWEIVHDISVSRDDQYLLIYHKTDKEPGRKFSTYNLVTQQHINTIKPGYGGNMTWTQDNNIVQAWGCGSPCHCFQLLNWKLEILVGDCATAFKYFIEQDIIVSVPLHPLQDGQFKVWSLTTGQEVLSTSFKAQYGEYYCWEIEAIDQELQVKLQFVDHPDSVITESIVLNK